MLHYQPEIPHILFLFSDTGGGHRSAAEAIIEALQIEYPDRFITEMVDVFRQYAPPPLDLAPDIYPPLARMPDVWQWGYRVSDGRLRMHMYSRAVYPYVRRSLQRLVREKPSDLYVSVHPLINGPILQALGEERNSPYVTVVTDMVTAHAFWYHPEADMTIVCTEQARKRALEIGLDPDLVKVVGLPVADRFCQPQDSKSIVRQRLGWQDDRPVVLLIGGGEGMGPLEKIARAINKANLPVSLVIVTGRNRDLKARLESLPWQVPAYIYGFVREMPDFMAAADVLITKAGPGTISEAFISGLPLILYSKMPGQEDGNVQYVVQQKAGVWAPTPAQVVATLKFWVENPEARGETSAISKSLANPQAARQVAHLLVRQLEDALAKE